MIKIHHSRKKDVLATVVYQEGRVGGKFRACRSLYLNTFVQLSDAPFMRVYLASRSVLTEGRQAGKPKVKGSRQSGRQVSWQ